MNVATQILAFWGAILSTILAVIEGMRFYYEGVRIKVEVRGNYVFFPKSEPYGEKSYILIIVSNKGRRQTTITHAWLRTATKTNLLATDCFFKGPQKLQEGDYTQFVMKEEDAPKYALTPKDYTAVVSDATGRKFYSHTLPIRWFKIARMKLRLKK